MHHCNAATRPFRRTSRVALLALTLPAALTLSGCANTTNVAAPAEAVASGPATNSAAVHSAVCAKVESAWAEFLPNAPYTIGTRQLDTGRTVDVYAIDYSAYERVSTALFAALTGNREYQLAYDVNLLATSAVDVYNDPGQSLSPAKDLAALKKNAAVVSADCHTTLAVPA